MGKTLYKHSYLTVVALSTALLISSSTAMVFAADTAKVKQEAAAVTSEVESIGRFVVTPKSSKFVPAMANKFA